MDIFTTLLLRLIPLYVAMGMGFIAARKLQVPAEPVSKIVFYLIVPVVFFSGALHAPLSQGLLALPLIPYAISTCLCIVFYRIAKRAYPDATKNVLAMSAGNANVGYFGLPVALMLFDKEGVSIYMVLMLGTTLYENTVGYYVTALGHFTARQALKKVARLPVLYGFSFGMALNICNLQPPNFLEDFLLSVRGCYTVLGMMIIGIGLAQLRHLRFDFRFIGLSFLGKFVCYPLLAYGFVMLDRQWLHSYEQRAHNALILISIVPMAANAVVLASLLNVHPEKVAITVFLSTIFALLYVPFMVMWIM